MEIRNYGWDCFRVKDKGKVVLLNPFSKKVSGIVFPKTIADLVLGKGDEEEEVRERIANESGKAPFWATGPGEYEVNGIEILGFPGGWWFKIEDWEIVFLNEAEKDFYKKRATNFREIHALFLNSSLSSQVKQLTRELSPSVLIPFCQKDISKSEMEKMEWTRGIIDVLDQENVTPVDLLKLERQNLPEETQVCLLKPKSFG